MYYLVCRKERFDVVVMQLQIFKEFIFKYLLRNGNLPRKIAPVNFFFFFFFYAVDDRIVIEVPPLLTFRLTVVFFFFFFPQLLLMMFMGF